MHPQDWTQADKLRAAELLTQYARALEELQDVEARRWGHIKASKLANTRPDAMLIGELTSAGAAIRARLALLGDALALLGIPPSPHVRAMSLAEYVQLPVAYKECIARWETACDAARKDGAR